MKKSFILLLFFVFALLLAACSNNNEDVVLAINNAETNLLAKLDSIAEVIEHEPEETQESTVSVEETTSIEETEPVEETTPLSKDEILLGEDNAFVDYYTTSEADERAKYYEKTLEEMIEILDEALKKTGKMGTSKVQASVKALIPEHIYSEGETAKEKVQSIYDYFTKGKISEYYTIEYYYDGYVLEVNIDIDNLINFVENGIECGVFVGSFENYELNPEITEIDEICERMEITREVAITMFMLMEMYDTQWIVGDNGTMLDNIIE